MSSLQNSEKTPLWQPKHETREFSKFGMQFRLATVTETRNQWTRVLKNKNGETLDTSDIEALKSKLEEDEKPSIEWVQTGVQVANSYVAWVRFTDDEGVIDKPVELVSTPDGPLLGIIIEETESTITLLDPCVLQYNQKNGSISYMPIFNVARTLRLERSAIRSRQAPAEIIVASYPGFILQNRMYQFQLRPSAPLETVPETDNNADHVVTTVTA